MLFILFLVLGQTVSQSAQIKVIPPKEEYCGSIQKVAKFVTTCENNKDLANLGLGCVVKLRKESKRVTDELVKMFSVGVASQVTNFSDHDKNLKAALAKLSALEKKNAVATRDILHYLMNIVHPDEIYEVHSAEEADSLLLKSNCFGTNRKKLLFALHKMEVNKEGIKSSQKILNEISVKSNQEIASLLMKNFPGDFAKIKEFSANVATEAVKPQKKDRGKSDISGTKEEMK